MPQPRAFASSALPSLALGSGDVFNDLLLPNLWKDDASWDGFRGVSALDAQQAAQSGAWAKVPPPRPPLTLHPH